ncbi:protein HIDE1 [Engystomops pustulosus]|uniref:protein HIDE1 n=1 Tax=Engystomops pustulosus TaxID=76066 RepID=UPI003AFB40C7
MELLTCIGLIGIKLVLVTSEVLPPPQLSVMTSGTLYMGQDIELQCTAPGDYPEGTFYLYSHSTGERLQTVHAPETKHSVTFTIETTYTTKSMEYVCMYESYVGTELQESEVSSVLSLTLHVPVWVFVVVGLAGLVILVASVLVTLYLVRRNKKKKQEQRDKDSIWIDQNITADWPVGNRNMVFSSNSTSKTDISNTHPSNMDSPSENGLALPFSTFRT